MTKDLGEILSIASQIVAYVIAIILIIQLLKAIFGGTWRIEEVILALVIFNLTIGFGIGGYLLHLNNKLSDVNTRILGHIEWHRGKKEAIAKR